MLKLVSERIWRWMASLVTLWILGYLKPFKMWNHIINSSSPVKNVACDTGRDKSTEVSILASQETCCRSEKLFGLWNSNDQKQGRILVAKLYKTCEIDFHVLFGYLDSPKNGSNIASSDEQGPFQTKEYAKVLHVYSVFTKITISDNILRLEDLLEALVDLCNLKNVFVVHWSLRVLHKILSDSSSMEKEFGGRVL